MGERISVPGIHKNCKKDCKEEGYLFRSTGGDIMVWCDYCGEQLQDPEKEILTKDENSEDFHVWRGGLSKEED